MAGPWSGPPTTARRLVFLPGEASALTRSSGITSHNFAASMPDLFPGATAQCLRQAASQFRRSVTNLEAQGAGIEQQQQQQPALQQRRRVASQPELQLLAQHHNVQWDATGSECSATSTSTAGSSSLDFQERCSAAVAKGLGPRAEAERFVADGSFDWELYNWVFMRALDQVSLAILHRAPACLMTCSCMLFGQAT